jgi:tetratricopeptide (TPR) repeat protein
MAIKGSLKEASLADVCQLLALGLKTGCLSIADKSRFGQIYFDKGRITYARIVNRRDRLGDLLVRDGLLTQDQLTAALELQRAHPDRKLGELLISRHFMNEQDLHLYIRIQIEEAIYHLFTWSRGNFFFEADERPEADITVSINPDTLLLEAARRVDEWSQIEKKIPSLDLIFEIEQDRLSESNLQLTRDQRRIVDLFDGTRSVEDVVEESGMDEFDVGRALYGLIQAGYAHRSERKVPVIDEARGRSVEMLERRNLGVAFYRAGMWEDAAREFVRVLELNASDFDARFHLALVSLRAEKYREALRQMKALLEEAGPSFAVFINMAYALRRLGRPTDALLVLNEADAIKPGSTDVPLSRGVAYLEAGDLDDAITSFKEYRDRLVGAQPPAIYFYYAALAHAIGGDLSVADRVITEGLGVHGAKPPLLLLAGAISERRGEYSLAERYYRQVTDEDPNIVHAHKNLGDVAYKRSSHQEAAEHYRRAIALDPDFGDDVYAKLGNIAYKMQLRDEALRHWTRALELNPDNEVVRKNLDIAAGAAV